MTDVDGYVADMDALCDAVLALRKRGQSIWNRAGRGEPPLTGKEIWRMRAALRRLQIVART